MLVLSNNVQHQFPVCGEIPGLLYLAPFGKKFSFNIKKRSLNLKEQFKNFGKYASLDEKINAIRIACTPSIKLPLATS